MRTVALLALLCAALPAVGQVTPDAVVLPLYDKPLTFRSKVQPTYPPEARHAHVEGTVLLHVLIGEDGHMQSVQPFFGPEMLRDAAVEVVRQWVYEPYVTNGMVHPVSTDIAVDYSFTPIWPKGVERMSQQYAPGSFSAASVPRNGVDYNAKFTVTKASDAYRVLEQQNQTSSFILVKGQVNLDGHLSEPQLEGGNALLLDVFSRITANSRFRLKVEQGQVVPYEIHLRYEFQRSDSSAD